MSGSLGAVGDGGSACSQLGGCLSCSAESEPPPQAACNLAGPFVHKYATANSKYLFDVNTSRILRVSPAIWDIIEDVGVLSRQDLVAKYSGTHSAEEVAQAHDAVVKAQENGLLSSHRPKEISVPYSQEYIREKLAHSRSTMTLVVTEQCNFRCSYCVYGGTYSHQRDHSARMMSWDTARQAIDDFLQHSGQATARSVHFYGGEPLLNLPLIRRSVEYITNERQQTDVRFTITTNGSLLRGEAAEFVASHGIRCSISLDGPQHIHDRYRRFADGSATWLQVMDNIRTFLDVYPEYRDNGLLGFHAVLAPPTDLRELDEFFATCDMFRPSMGFSLGSVSTCDTSFFESIPATSLRVGGHEDLYQRFINSMRDGTLGRDHREPAMWVLIALFERDVIGFYKRGYASAQHPLLPDRLCPMPTCLPGVRRLFTNIDGTYYPCERVQQTSSVCIGNVREGVSVQKVFDLLGAYVDLGKAGCLSCWCLPMCMAGCVAMVMEDGKPDASARKHACDSYRRTAHRVMTDVSAVLESSPKALDYMDSITLV